MYFRRESSILVTTNWQPVPVACPGTAWPQGMHGAYQSYSAVVRVGRGPFSDHGEHPVRMFDADGPEHRFCHRPKHIVQR